MPFHNKYTPILPTLFAILHAPPSSVSELFFSHLPGVLVLPFFPS